MFFSTKELSMEKMRNKDGKVISYREKVYFNGKAIAKTFKRKSDALAWKKNHTLELQRKEALGIDDIQSIDFKSFSELWVKMKEDQGRSKKTISDYQTIIDLYLSPLLDKKKLEKVTFGMAQQVLQLCRKKNLGPARINAILTVLKQMLGDAIKFNYLIRGPLKGMKSIPIPQRSLTYWMPEQIEQFLSRNLDDPAYPIFLLALNTGMRRGELMGLCWDKVSLDKRVIEISRTRDHREGLRDTTKTKVLRHIPINDTVWEMLERPSRNKNHERFVFAKKDGSLPDPNHLSDRDFKKAIKRAFVTPRIRFHDLRATYASNFVMAGGDIFALSKLLGHTSVEMTAKNGASPQVHAEYGQAIQFGSSLKAVS